MNPREYQEQAKSLRHNSMVEAWIKQRQRDPWNVATDCSRCGFPHNPGLICNGAPFGEIVFGGHTYYISISNVVWWVEFMCDYAPIGAFHWKNEWFFRKVNDNVEVTFFTSYNNTPQPNTLLIPLAEWKSITGVIEGVQP